MSNIKSTATNEQIRQKLIDTNNSMVVTRGKVGGRVVRIGGQIYDDGRFYSVVGSQCNIQMMQYRIIYL